MVNVGRNFFPSPRGTKQKRTKSKTCRTNGTRPFFSFFLSRHLVAQGEIPNTPLYRSSTHFFFFFFFHATSGQRAEVPDTLFNPSPTVFFFFTPPRGTEKKSTTHCSNGPQDYVARQTNGFCKQHKWFLWQNKIKNKTVPRYIATLIHKKQAKKRKQTRATAKHNIEQPIIT